MLIWLHLSSLLSCLGLTLMGLASAPIFPSLIATTPDRLGGAHTAHGIGFQIAAAVLGQSLVPGFIGVLARRWGLEMIGPSLLTASLLLLLLYEVLMATRLKPVPEDG
jgi:fucose permease